MEKLVLKNNMFQVVDQNENEGKTNFLIRWNTNHYIYKSHFPNNPITPGVCLIQIAKELVNEMLSTELFIKEVKNVKFNNAINPIADNKVVFSILCTKKENFYHANVVVFNENNIFTKLSLELTTQKL